MSVLRASLIVAVASSLLSLTACSGTVVGTGTSGTSGSPGSTLGGGTDTGGATTTDAGAKNTGAGGVTQETMSEYEPLFAAPATTALTPSTLRGLWAGTMSNTRDDVRMQVGTNSITIAVHCAWGGHLTPVVVGMQVAAVVSTTSIRLLETKTVGTQCQINVRPQTIPVCSTTTHDFCFIVSDGTLHIDIPLFSGDGTFAGDPDPSFTKLSD